MTQLAIRDVGQQLVTLGDWKKEHNALDSITEGKLNTRVKL